VRKWATIIIDERPTEIEHHHAYHRAAPRHAPRPKVIIGGFMIEASQTAVCLVERFCYLFGELGFNSRRK
jgi:hypothetical protein